jgi:hypothetical protein
VLEREHLPYVLKPLHLHDFLDKVSDLLLEAQAISKPLRPVLSDVKGRSRRRKAHAAGGADKEMFASGEDYMMTEEEITEWEKQEEEERQKKKKKATKEIL